VAIAVVGWLVHWIIVQRSANPVSPDVRPQVAVVQKNSRATTTAAPTSAPQSYATNTRMHPAPEMIGGPTVVPTTQPAAISQATPLVPSSSEAPATEPATTAPALATTVPVLATTAPAVAATAPTLATTMPTTLPQWTLKRPPLAPTPIPAPMVTDEQIGQASQRGVNWMLSRFSAATYQLDPRRASTEAHFAGLNALCVYSLIETGRVISDTRISATSPTLARLIDAMKQPPTSYTYDRAVRLAALAVLARPQDRAAIIEHANALLNGQRKGAYGYTAEEAGRNWDNSNTQYAIMGVWAAADAGLDVPHDYWAMELEHWAANQLANGQWSYKFRLPPRTGHVSPPLPGSISMTAAGMASILICRDYADMPTFHGEVGRDPFSPELRRALEWWETGDNSISFDNAKALDLSSYGYWLFGVSRVGLASGLKYFGTHDWYRELSARAVATQRADGSWGDDVQTAFTLLFLARGRWPIMMNKLRTEHPGQTELNNRLWNNRPHDVANLARWTGRQLERPLNWQIVDLLHDPSDWLDSPILYFASHRPITFTDTDYANFREYVHNGGTIFTQDDGDDPSFDRFMQEFARKLFPQYELADLPSNHPLYTTNFHLSGRPPIKAISNGARLLLIYVPSDISRYWHARDTDVHRYVFEFGANLFLYAGGKRNYRNRIDSPYIPPPAARSVLTVDLGRIKYGGNWDPEPGAYERFRRNLHTQTGYDLAPREVTLKQIDPSLPICHLTGTEPFVADEGEIRAMRQYVEAGGVLFIDACGGSKSFGDSARRAVLRAFPDHPFEAISADHKLLNASQPGMFDLSQRRVRAFTKESVPDQAGAFEILSAGKGHVIFTRLDVTSGLLGTETWGIIGYAPEYCSKFMQNLVLWTLDGQQDD
jgi:hypothetical protein